MQADENTEYRQDTYTVCREWHLIRQYQASEVVEQLRGFVSGSKRRPSDKQE